MRSCLVGVSALVISLSTGAWAQSDQPDFPSYAFSDTWTSLPTDHFGDASPTAAPVTTHLGHTVSIEDERAERLLGEAYTSSGDDAFRREVALNEMMTPWPAEQRTSFQKLRDAKAAYGGDEQHARHFAALVTRVVDGTGRSVAVDGSATAALDTAYAAALSREDDSARAKTEASQKAFVAYRETFAAFADGNSLGTGMAVAVELNRERTADLAAQDR